MLYYSMLILKVTLNLYKTLANPIITIIPNIYTIQELYVYF